MTAFLWMLLGGGALVFLIVLLAVALLAIDAVYEWRERSRK